MNKPKLKLGFTDYFKPLDDFFIETLSQVFDIERDDNNPDYLIFCDENFGQNNRRYDSNRVVKIFFTGENRRSWHYDTHYSITFDHVDRMSHFRLPLYVVDNWVYVKKNLPDIRDLKRNETADKKTGFCSFVVKNSSCEKRNNMFHKLSEYKRVDSAGPLFNNMGPILENQDFHIGKLNFLSKYKFNLCYENSTYPGYVTEKPFMSFYASSIPIYWGDPVAAMDFNADAMINRHDYDSDEEMIEAIKMLDQDDDKYNEMVQQPILNPRNKSFDLTRLNRWFAENVYRG